MARDKTKDDKMFNCSQQHEHKYVTGLYSYYQQDQVSSFLKDGCSSNLIYNSTHKEVYELIKKKLGFEIPN